MSLVIGGSSNQVVCRNPTLPHRRPPATALCEGARAGGFAVPSYTISYTITGDSTSSHFLLA